MRRLSAASSILAISLLAIGGLASATLAQDASPATATSPAVGAWLIDTDGDQATAPVVAALHPDGTYIHSGGPAGATGIGSWESTGPNTGALTVSEVGADPATGAFGITTIRATFEVSPDGQTLIADYTIQFVGSDGTDSGQLGPATATGTRIAVEPVGTPVAPIPAPSPCACEGSPAPSTTP